MIFTGEPLWFVLLCLILAGGFAMGLYYRDRKTEIPVTVRWALAFVRFLSVFIIAFLLLSPFVKSITRTREKPLVIIAQDNSGSVAMNPDSSYYRDSYLKELDDLAGSLESDYEVKRIIFGEEVQILQPGESLRNRVDYEAKLTNISDLFSGISTLFSNRNLGAVILSTDGVYNAGFNPVYITGQTGYPVYAVALGDTAQRKDIILSHVAYNRIVYLNNKFPFQVSIQAYEFPGTRTTLGVSENGQSLFSQEILIDQADFTSTVTVILEAKETGLKRYRVSLSPAEGELSTENNFKDIFIEVLDARNKILVLYHSPHPDVAALRKAAEANLNYEVEDYDVAEFTGSLEAYNLVILHQLPAKENPAASLLAELKEKEVPVLFILGTQSDMVRINDSETGMKVISSRALFEEALPSFNPDFGLFSLADDTRQMITAFPPLTVPVGDYQPGNMAHILAFQRIGTLQTSRPMILLSQNIQYRSGLIAGEGIWRWRMMNYEKSGNHDAFNELFNKIFQYLSLREQKRNLRIYHKGSFPEYERVEFDAEVYNRNFELVNEPDLEMIIMDEGGSQFPFTFSRAMNSYRLDAGRFVPGNYTFTAKVQVGEEFFTASGQFSVTRIDLESMNLVADHNLLHAIAARSDGRLFMPGQLDLLRDDILENSDIKPLIYTRKKITELINFPWLLASIIVLLAAEWFVRKRSGSY